MSVDGGKAVPADPDLIAQIQDLQSRLAYQEDAITEINKQMGQQAEELIFLKRYIRELNGKIKELKGQANEGNLGDFDPANERPPHY